MGMLHLENNVWLALEGRNSTWTYGKTQRDLQHVVEAPPVLLEDVHHLLLLWGRERGIQLNIDVDVVETGAAANVGNRHRGLFLPDRMEHGVHDLLNAIVQLGDRGDSHLRDSTKAAFPSCSSSPYSGLCSTEQSSRTRNLRRGGVSFCRQQTLSVDFKQLPM